ncbi:sigma 54-interacting transcriptional regulator [Desulfovibrio sp. OttesenSCG-928-C06]|nr:sigma 54-interacting transcriptional regulator [Desulfovibrio sp. OttesenSCG-928-C06]
MKHNDSIRVQRERFQSGLDIDPFIVRSAILSSWRRSLKYGINSVIESAIAADEEALRESISRNRELIESAANTMEELVISINDPQSLIGLCDSSGLVLHSIGQEEELALFPAFRRGHRVDEEHAGTNAVGLCLVEKRPVEVLGYEHYSSTAQHWCGLAAPVLDRDGALAGVLTVATGASSYHKHTLGVVKASARAISEQLRLREMLREQSVMLELIDEGVIVLDSQDRIISMNGKAGLMLQIDARSVGQPIGEVVKDSPTLFAALASRQKFNDQETLLQLASGVQAQCVLSLAPVAATGGLVLTLREAKRMREYTVRTIGAKSVYTFENIIGDSEPLQKVLDLARVATRSDITTLVLGESGTGKELFAQAIHNASSRHSGPFVVVNCGALPRSLIESELFGYAEGAFTGAKRTGKPGKFELADGGTIFLDEIGEMPLDAQASLLRLLQEGELTRIGGNRQVKINIRVIAATNKNLEEEVAKKAFREDLFYRLNVFTLLIPPLRQRKSDIRPLCEHFLFKFAASLGKPVTGFSPEAMSLLMMHNWPGNVRELENTIERTINVSQGGLIDVLDLPSYILMKGIADCSLGDTPGECDTLKSRERELIIEALKDNGGNVRATAGRLGIARSALYKKIQRFGISPDQWRGKAQD